MREYSVPARFTVGEHDNIAAVVFEHERDDPSYVIYQRQIDGVWTDVTCAEAADQIRSAALGLISLGVEAGDRVSIFSATCYEWACLLYTSPGDWSDPRHPADPESEPDDPDDSEYDPISGEFAGIAISEFIWERQHARRMVLVWVALVLAITGLFAAVGWTIGSNLSGVL